MKGEYSVRTFAVLCIEALKEGITEGRFAGAGLVYGVVKE